MCHVCTLHIVILAYILLACAILTVLYQLLTLLCTHVISHYKGWLEDGTLFDDTYQRDQPLYFVLGGGQVIQGFEEAIPNLSQKAVCSITVPPDLAYGDTGYPPIIPPLAILKYEIELVTFSSTGTEERLHRERKKGVM